MSIEKWSSFVRLNLSSRTCWRHLREALSKNGSLSKSIQFSRVFLERLWLAVTMTNQCGHLYCQWVVKSSICKPYSENIFTTFSTSIMSKVFINSNINPNMNASNATLQKNEEEIQSKKFRKLSLVPQVALQQSILPCRYSYHYWPFEIGSIDLIVLVLGCPKGHGQHGPSNTVRIS